MLCVAVPSGEWRIITAWSCMVECLLCDFGVNTKGLRLYDFTQEPERRVARLCVGCWPSSIVGKFR